MYFLISYRWIDILFNTALTVITFVVLRIGTPLSHLVSSFLFSYCSCFKEDFFLSCTPETTTGHSLLRRLKASLFKRFLAAVHTVQLSCLRVNCLPGALVNMAVWGMETTKHN